MGRTLIIADPDDKKPFAILRGLDLAARLGQDADVVGFTYAPLKSIPGGKKKQDEVRKRLLADRESQVRAQIDRYAAEGQQMTDQRQAAGCIFDVAQGRRHGGDASDTTRLSSSQRAQAEGTKRILENCWEGLRAPPAQRTISTPLTTAR